MAPASTQRSRLAVISEWHLHAMAIQSRFFSTAYEEEINVVLGENSVLRDLNLQLHGPING